MIIDRHISSEIVKPFCLGLGLLVLVFIGYSTSRQLSMAAAGQFGLPTALKLIGFNTLITLEILLPSAFFFSVLSAVGKLYRDSEMSALYAAGVSHSRVLFAVFKLAVVVAALTGLISIIGRPWAYATSYQLEARAAAQYDLKQMAAGEFINVDGADYTFIAQDVDLARGVHQDVFLQKTHEEHGLTEIIVAEEAVMPTLNPGQALKAVFYNGRNYLLDHDGHRDITLKFKELEVRLPNEEARESYRRKAESTRNLARSVAPKDIAEYQWRITTPLATLLLALIAVPLARSAPRESRFRNFAIALLAYIGLFALVSVLRTLLEQGKLPAMPGLWGAYAFQAMVLVYLARQPRMQRR